jgi:hypothetical protein
MHSTAVAAEGGNEPDLKVLHAKIGQQALELDFLSALGCRYQLYSDEALVEHVDDRFLY